MDYELKNGRRYRVTDTGQPYVGGEYPSGGLLIRGWNPSRQDWDFIDHSPSQQCVDHFLTAAEKLGPFSGQRGPHGMATR